MYRSTSTVLPNRNKHLVKLVGLTCRRLARSCRRVGDPYTERMPRGAAGMAWHASYSTRTLRVLVLYIIYEYYVVLDRI